MSTTTRDFQSGGDARSGRAAPAPAASAGDERDAGRRRARQGADRRPRQADRRHPHRRAQQGLLGHVATRSNSPTASSRWTRSSTPQGVKLLIDPKASLFLIGTEMDYEEEKLKSGFVFRNPEREGPLRLRRILPRLKIGHGSFRAAGTAGGARSGARVARQGLFRAPAAVASRPLRRPSARRARRASSEAAALNDAYRTLKDPLSRAVYLAELRGVELPGDGKTIDDPDLLMEAMEAREALHEAATADAVDALAARGDEADAEGAGRRWRICSCTRTSPPSERRSFACATSTSSPRKRVRAA